MKRILFFLALVIGLSACDMVDSGDDWHIVDLYPDHFGNWVPLMYGHGPDGPDDHCYVYRHADTGARKSNCAVWFVVDPTKDDSQ